MTPAALAFTPTVPPAGQAGRASPAGAWHPGLAGGCRHGEIFAPADEASGAGLALALALDAAGAAAPAAADHPDQRSWLWVQDKPALRLSGRPYRPGLPPGLRHRLVHVAASGPEDALFAIEEGLRCRDLAFVIGEIAGNPRALGLTAARRLSLAAERHGVALWLIRLDARRDLGSARMRWEACAAPSLAPRWNPQAPGAAAWQAELFRAHTFQPGWWVLRDDGRLVAEQAGVGAHASLLRPAQDERGSARVEGSTVSSAPPFSPSRSKAALT